MTLAKDKLYHALAKTIKLCKKGQYDSKIYLEFMRKLTSGLKNLLGDLSNYVPPKNLAIFDLLPPATPRYFCLSFFKIRKSSLGRHNIPS